jgi:hypothetical protein
MDRWMDGWMGEWVGGWMDGWTVLKQLIKYASVIYNIYLNIKLTHFSIQ